MKWIVWILLVTFAVTSAEAKQFSGYKINRAAGELELTGHVEQFLETPTEFKILIMNNAAFYLFPKQEQQVEIKKLLQQSQEQKKKLNFKINAFSREIVSLETIEVK